MIVRKLTLSMFATMSIFAECIYGNTYVSLFYRTSPTTQTLTWRNWPMTLDIYVLPLPSS